MSAGLETHPPHDYGVAVILFGAADRGIVPQDQVAGLREGIETFLLASQLTLVSMDQANAMFAKARDMATKLPDPSRTLLNYVNDRAVSKLGPALVPYLRQFGSDDPALSPQRVERPASAPLFLLHGDDDTVIPAAESAIFAEDLRRKGADVHVLLSGLITHAEVNRAATYVDVWKLINLWAAGAAISSSRCARRTRRVIEVQVQTDSAQDRGVNDSTQGTRLQKVLSQAGVASRRAAEKLIADGRVSVNGKTILTMGVKVAPEADDIRVDGRRIKAAAKLRYILLYKPAGYVTTRSDPQRRRTVLDLLEGVREYVYPSAGWTTTPKGFCCSRTTAIWLHGSHTRDTAWRAPTKYASQACPIGRRSIVCATGSPLTVAARFPPKRCC